ncbi:hypothetical protein MKW11_06980 [Gluconobacter frateurii]|uniref:hypothetical protein n=1 Tax=Gluconobacter frateurii TaxID=38308 RepID=UPI001F06F74A|nr:hypothetical protein [Gluconobacter frateurii]UMM09777.1 hypothetical protein MKW11_06980 [Gluconobacter frateurii]
MRTALSGVERLFLLNAVTGDEFTQAILTLNLAREAGVKYVVYLSVLHADRIVNVLHFAVQSGAERTTMNLVGPDTLKGQIWRQYGMGAGSGALCQLWL